MGILRGNTKLAQSVYKENLMKELCGQETEVCARIVGYYRPVSQWNKGKKAEFKDRQSYSVIPNIDIPKGSILVLPPITLEV